MAGPFGCGRRERGGTSALRLRRPQFEFKRSDRIARAPSRARAIRRGRALRQFDRRRRRLRDARRACDRRRPLQSRGHPRRFHHCRIPRDVVGRGLEPLRRDRRTASVCPARLRAAGWLHRRMAVLRLADRVVCADLAGHAGLRGRDLARACAAPAARSCDHRVYDRPDRDQRPRRYAGRLDRKPSHDREDCAARPDRDRGAVVRGLERHPGERAARARRAPRCDEPRPVRLRRLRCRRHRLGRDAQPAPRPAHQHPRRARDLRSPVRAPDARLLRHPGGHGRIEAPAHRRCGTFRRAASGRR